jgi:hypothetical protein
MTPGGRIQQVDAERQRAEPASVPADHLGGDLLVRKRRLDVVVDMPFTLRLCMSDCLMSRPYAITGIMNATARTCFTRWKLFSLAITKLISITSYSWSTSTDASSFLTVSSVDAATSILHLRLRLRPQCATSTYPHTR